MHFGGKKFPRAGCQKKKQNQCVRVFPRIPSPFLTTTTTLTMMTTVTNGNTYIAEVLGALPTTFTPAPSRFRTLISTGTHLQLAHEHNCLPPDFTPCYDDASLHVLRYFSTGVCPDGYGPAATIPSWQLATGEAGVQCCPRCV